MENVASATAHVFLGQIECAVLMMNAQICDRASSVSSQYLL